MSRRDLRGEAAFLPTSLEDAADLQDYLVAAGLSEPVAAGIANWLTRKATNRPDRTNASTRARYRKILDSIEPPAPTPDPDRRLTVVDGEGKGSSRRRSGAGGKLASVALALGLAAPALGGGASSSTPAPLRPAAEVGVERREPEGSVKSTRGRRRRAA